MEHGTLGKYTTGKCRCDACRAVAREYNRARRAKGGHRMHRAPDTDRDRLSDLLNELCPDGLTDDCPARRARAAAA